MYSAVGKKAAAAWFFFFFSFFLCCRNTDDKNRSTFKSRPEWHFKALRSKDSKISTEIYPTNCIKEGLHTVDFNHSFLLQVAILHFKSKPAKQHTSSWKKKQSVLSSKANIKHWLRSLNHCCSGHWQDFAITLGKPGCEDFALPFAALKLCF